MNKVDTVCHREDFANKLKLHFKIHVSCFISTTITYRLAIGELHLNCYFLGEASHPSISKQMSWYSQQQHHRCHLHDCWCSFHHKIQL